METKTVDQKLSDLNTKLEEYTNALKLPKCVCDGKVEEILSMQYADLSKLTAEQCAEFQFELGRYNYQLQRETNKEHVVLNWCDTNLKAMAAKDSKNYDKFMPYETRKMMTVMTDEVAEKLQTIKVVCQTRIDAVQFLGTRIEFIAKTLSDLRQCKMRHNNG